MHDQNHNILVLVKQCMNPRCLHKLCSLPKISMSFNLHSKCYEIKMTRDPKRLFLFCWIILAYIFDSSLFVFSNFLIFFLLIYCKSSHYLFFNLKCDFNTYKGFFKNLGPNLLDVEKQLSNFYNRFQQVAKIWKKNLIYYFSTFTFGL